jgi:hypothetical protein
VLSDDTVPGPTDRIRNNDLGWDLINRFTPPHLCACICRGLCSVSEGQRRLFVLMVLALFLILSVGPGTVSSDSTIGGQFLLVKS